MGFRYLQLGLTKANSSLQERIRVVLFTLGRGNFVHLETIVRHVSRPRLLKEKREALDVFLRDIISLPLIGRSLNVAAFLGTRIEDDR